MRKPSHTVLPIYLLRRRPPTPGWNEYWDELAKQNSLRPFILAISSRVDEAWQLLHHLRDIPNPLEPKTGLPGFIWQNYRAYTKRSCEIARIQGVSMFGEQTPLVKILVAALWLLALFLWLSFGPK